MYEVIYRETKFNNDLTNLNVLSADFDLAFLFYIIFTEFVITKQRTFNRHLHLRNMRLVFESTTITLYSVNLYFTPTNQQAITC